MNQVIFASDGKSSSDVNDLDLFDVIFTPISDITARVGDGITDKPNEDFIKVPRVKL